jgi:hypothetical protein
MSFSSLNSPATNGARGLIRGRSLPAMAKAVGVVAGAGMLAASYQILYEEGRGLVGSIRSNATQRHNRNDAVSLVLLTTELPLPAQDKIRRSRDAFRAAMALATDPSTPENYRAILRDALSRLVNRDT